MQRGQGIIKAVGLFLAGSIQALSFAPDPFPSWLLGPVQIFAMAWLTHCVWQAGSLRQAFFYAWVFGLGGFVIGLYWLTISMHYYGGMPLPMAILALVLLSAYLAIFPGIAAWTARWVNRFRHTPLACALAWASAWTVGEWLRSTLFTGFPWMAIGYAHVDGWLSGWASIFGVLGVHFVAAFVAASLGILLSPKTFQPFRLQSFVTAMIAVMLCVAGFGNKHIQWSVPVGQPLSVRIVQGNVEQGTKFLSSQVIPSIRHHLQLAQSPPAPTQAAGAAPPHLILLPETVIPVFQYQLDPTVWQAWQQLAGSSGASVMMGAPLHDRATGRYTNSVIRLDQDTNPALAAGPQPGWRYDKHHLVPFGEFIPWGFRWFVNLMAIPLGDFDRGPKQQHPFVIADQLIAPNICYEDVFGEELLPALHPGPDGKAGATILANFSNLGWFGDTWALRQHWQMARMRAIETARPMLRATNTGISGAIGVRGEPMGQLLPARSGVLDLSIQGHQGLTPYARGGNIPILVLSLLILAMCRLRLLRRRES